MAGDATGGPESADDTESSVSPDNGTDFFGAGATGVTSEQVDRRLAYYSNQTKEARSAIQVIGVSASLLSVFTNLTDLSPFQSTLAKVALVCLSAGLACAIVSYGLAYWHQPKDYRVSETDSTVDPKSIDILQSATHDGAGTAVSSIVWAKRTVLGAYLFFSLGIALLLGVLYLAV